MDGEVRESFWRIDLDPDLAPLAVFGFVRGVISEDVLVPEFESDLVADVLQFIDGVREERLPTADLREILNNGPAVRIWAEVSGWIYDSDNKNIGDESFFRQKPSFISIGL